LSRIFWLRRCPRLTPREPCNLPRSCRIRNRRHRASSARELPHSGADTDRSQGAEAASGPGTRRAPGRAPEDSGKGAHTTPARPPHHSGEGAHTTPARSPTALREGHPEHSGQSAHSTPRWAPTALRAGLLADPAREAASVSHGANRS